MKTAALRTYRSTRHQGYLKAALGSGRHVVGAAVERLERPFLHFSSVVEKSQCVRSIQSGEKLCLPDFLGIGAQKAGTTWLYENLRHHPELYLPKKELQYFDRRFHRSLRSYAAKFEAGWAKIKGEITPSYSILPVERIRFIRTVMPSVKLIFLMRNPVERAWSQALMFLVTSTGRRFEEVDDSEFYTYFRSARLKRGDYLMILDNWLSVFPRDQLFIGFFEDVLERPRDLLSEILSYIGASKDVDWSRFPYDRVIRAGPGIPMGEGQRRFLEGMYRDDIEVLYDRFGGRVSGWRC